MPTLLSVNTASWISAGSAEAGSLATVATYEERDRRHPREGEIVFVHQDASIWVFGGGQWVRIVTEAVPPAVPPTPTEAPSESDVEGTCWDLLVAE